MRDAALCLAAVLCLATYSCAAITPAAGAPADWEQAIRDLDSLVHQISLVNLINGLRLTPDQAAELRGLAKQFEADAPRLQAGAEFPADLDGCRKTYVALREVLVKGLPVSPELERQVVEARTTHARFVRSTLLAKPGGSDTACTNCHGASRKATGQVSEPMALTPAVKYQTDIAHIVADYGLAGAKRLSKAAPQVKAIIGEDRRTVFAKFACCLIPPSDMASPIRVGQAESGAKELELLRGVRKIPPAEWPAAREALCKGMDWVAELVSPGAVQQKKAEARESLGQAMDRARELTDLEFELEKDKLAATISRLSTPPQDDWPEKAAFFLLVPGSAGIYDRYMERLSKEVSTGKADATRQRPPARTP